MAESPSKERESKVTSYEDDLLPLGRHVIIESVTPSVDGGRYPAKRVVGDRVVVEADIFRDGHDVIRAVVLWKKKGAAAFAEAPMAFFDNDRWRGEFVVSENADYVFTVQAWTDPFATWLADFKKRVDAGQDVASESLEGVALLDRAALRARSDGGGMIQKAAQALKSRSHEPREALKTVSAAALSEAMARAQERWDAVTFSPELTVAVDRPRAEFGAWYELFIRSQTDDKRKSGTFATAERRLSDIKAMGFDVLYLPPIHPIGHTARKGPNNTLSAGPADPGSPWAIGNENGGHTAVEPSLGTIEDFDRFVARANGLGMEVALDFAVQCSPDHPWIKEHPEWFYQRPDGTIKYAENPPKKYEDIYPLNFDSLHAESLWMELRDVVRFWVKHGVKIFRVDNPHTKPTVFWEWLIQSVRADHPDVLFLAEAFTRPKVMKALAKAGFNQSYTYFTWRNGKAELMEYLTELSKSEMVEYYRPNFFANTPDILHAFLQNGGRPAFLIRATLAATMAPTWGIYSGFELCENDAVTGTEEYLNSEKFEIKPRDWNLPGNIKDYIGRLNAIRNENVALQQLRNIEFFETKSDAIIGYARFSDDRSNVLINVVSLDPYQPRDTWLRLPLDRLGFPWDAKFEVLDLLTGRRFTWGEHNWVRLEPSMPAHVLRIERRVS
ncbi:MAG: alpha-1,4-glucan--maltose-1-phosphate maltosyltransferase [Elusimicrobia bacterium]|nr:alpha-1,4-glucan--maltose-1-phosphate maltosyltransferase [Elusimicrobiota bacterium]